MQTTQRRARGRPRLELPSTLMQIGERLPWAIPLLASLPTGGRGIATADLLAAVPELPPFARNGFWRAAGVLRAMGLDIRTVKGHRGWTWTWKAAPRDLWELEVLIGE